MSLYQDAAGTIPALLPGDPVGLITRAAGTVDASQATQASKPTLGRWPKGGRRNLLTWTEEFSSSDWLKLNCTASGLHVLDTPVSATPILRRNVGVAAGPYVLRYKVKAVGGLAGVSLLVSTSEGNPSARLNLTTGETLVGDARVNLTAVQGEDGYYLVTASITSYVPIVYFDWRLLNVWPSTGSGTPYLGDGTKGIDLKDIQFEAGAVATPYQKVTTSLDITEPGVPSVWHLYNDGGDNMPVTLPAGEYGLAWVDVLGGVSTTTVTSDGTTPISLLRTERMADVLIRQGALSPVEIQEITAYWEARYK